MLALDTESLAMSVASASCRLMDKLRNVFVGVKNISNLTFVEPAVEEKKTFWLLDDDGVPTLQTAKHVMPPRFCVKLSELAKLKNVVVLLNTTAGRGCAENPVALKVGWLAPVPCDALRLFPLRSFHWVTLLPDRDMVDFLEASSQMAQLGTSVGSKLGPRNVVGNEMNILHQEVTLRDAVHVSSVRYESQNVDGARRGRQDGGDSGWPEICRTKRQSATSGSILSYN